MRDAEIREQLNASLRSEGAHAGFEGVTAKFPPKLRGETAGLPYSAWQLVEHIRLAQRDLLDFSRNEDGHYHEPKWPDDYWPKSATTPNDAAWDASLHGVIADRDAMVALVRDPKRDLTADFAWAPGKNLLRSALLIIDHNAYHLGELLALRRLLGIWPAK
jgi:hypothetical protein